MPLENYKILNDLLPSFMFCETEDMLERYDLAGQAGFKGKSCSDRNVGSVTFGPFLKNYDQPTDRRTGCNKRRF